MKTTKSKLYSDSPLGLTIARILNEIKALNKQFGFPKKKGAATQEERDAERILEIARATLHFIDQQGPKFDNNSAPGIGGITGAVVDVLKLAKSLLLKKTPAGDSKLPDISVADNHLTFAIKSKLLPRATDAMFAIINKHLVSADIKHYEREPHVDAIKLTEELFNTIKAEFVQWLADNDTSENKIVSKIAIETFNHYFTFANFENGISDESIQAGFAKLSHAVNFTKAPIDVAIKTKQQKMFIKSRSAAEKVFSFFKIVTKYLVGPSLGFDHANFNRVISHEATYRLAMTLFDVLNTTPDSIEELLSFLDVETPLKLVNIPLPMLPPEITINLKPDPAKLKKGKKTPDQSYAIALAYFRTASVVIAEMIGKYLAMHPERALADYEKDKRFSLYLKDLTIAVTEDDVAALTAEERKLSKLVAAIDDESCHLGMLFDGETNPLPSTILHHLVNGQYEPVYFPTELRAALQQRIDMIKARMVAINTSTQRKPLTRDTIDGFISARLLIKSEIDAIAEKMVANADAQFRNQDKPIVLQQLKDELKELRTQQEIVIVKHQDNFAAQENLMVKVINDIDGEIVDLLDIDHETVIADDLAAIAEKTTALDKELQVLGDAFVGSSTSFENSRLAYASVVNNAASLETVLQGAHDALETKRVAGLRQVFVDKHKKAFHEQVALYDILFPTESVLRDSSIKLRAHEFIKILVEFNLTGNATVLLAELNKTCHGDDLLPIVHELKLSLNHFLAGTSESESNLADISDKDIHKAILKIKQHGETLISGKNPSNVACGNIAINLSQQLETMARRFYATPADEKATNEFKQQFMLMLHSQDKAMNLHRNRWKVILANVAIACTGIGAIALAVRCIQRRNTGREFMFFAETKRHKLVNNVERVTLRSM